MYSGIASHTAVFTYTKGLSVKLLGRYTDIARAHCEIDSFHGIYRQSKLIPASVGIEESAPRLASLVSNSVCDGC